MTIMRVESGLSNPVYLQNYSGFTPKLIPVRPADTLVEYLIQMVGINQPKPELTNSLYMFFELFRRH